MGTLRLKETILAALCGIEGELIAYWALYTLTEKVFPVHWLNWETSLWEYSPDTQYPTVLSKFLNNNRQVVLLCDLVLCCSSASCQICALPAPGPPSLLWQILSLPLCLVLADLMLGIADARKTVSNPLWVQLKINSSTSAKPGAFHCFKYLFSFCLGDVHSVWLLKLGNGQSTRGALQC